VNNAGQKNAFTYHGNLVAHFPVVSVGH